MQDGQCKSTWGGSIARRIGRAAELAAPSAIRGPSAAQIPLQIEAGRGRPLHEQISEQIRLLIAEGKLRPGSYLPSSRQLADQLGVSRNTVLLAFSRLASEGYIEAAKGSHTFVSQAYANAWPLHGYARKASAQTKSIRRPPILFRGEAATTGASRPQTDLRFLRRSALPTLLSAPHLAPAAAQAACLRRLGALRISASGGIAGAAARHRRSPGHRARDECARSANPHRKRHPGSAQYHCASVRAAWYAGRNRRSRAIAARCPPSKATARR